MKLPLTLLLCTVFLLSAAVFADLAMYLAVGGLASVDLSCSLTTLFLSNSSVVGSRSATSYLATGLVSARSLHHCIRRMSCGLLEVGLRYVLDLAASHHLGHPCLPLHLWSHCSFLGDLDLFLKLRHGEEFPGCPHFIWDISLAELEMQISRLFSL